MLFNGDTGTVCALSNGRIQISFNISEACDRCGLKIICAPGKETGRILTLKDPGDLVLGQAVQVAEVSNLELHLALIQFGLPLLLFLSGLLSAYYLIPISAGVREIASFASGLLGLGISFPLARILMQWIADNISERYLRIIACETPA